eukprot:TRINITY_DN12414_c0_g1_i2.p1 TRINITY_DN12414_c0_g1~~TRINITY_DN12414_c0_g1_i2.p1  ORF type:complete len:339 (+),score=120.89 TRINITY_DN12414_c0_g1_i2:58-1017(+)
MLSLLEILGVLFIVQAVLRVLWGLWKDPAAVERVKEFYEKYAESMEKLDTNKGRLLVLDSPGEKGRVGVLFVHGSCARMGQFEAQIEYFMNRGHHVVAYDAIGCGRSDKPVCMDGNTYHPRRFVGDAVKVLHSKFDEDEKVVVVGHSFGCYVAMQAASKSEKVIGTVYIGSSPMWEDNVKEKTKIFNLPNAVLWYIRPILGMVFAKKALAPAGCRSLRKQEAEASSQNPVHMFCSFWRNIHHITHPDNHPTLPEHPVLLISGHHDSITPRAHADKLASMLPDATHVVIPDAAHQCMQEQPHLVCEHIGEYIERILSTAA